MRAVPAYETGAVNDTKNNLGGIAMKVLVLGGTRFAGVHLVNSLLEKGHDVTVANRGKTQDNFGSVVKRKIVERRNADSLKSAFGGESYDAVVDNIAFSSNDIRILLDAVKTEKYVMTSTVSVYGSFHMDMREDEVDTTTTPLKWCEYEDFGYDEVKRQAEAAQFQAYSQIPSVAVRFPWIFGTDDYTKRLFFYVEHIIKGQAMNIDNLDVRLSFIHSREAGDFLSWCTESGILGAVNACSNGTISLAEIIEYTEKRAGKKAIICSNGQPGTLNHVPSFSIDTTKAQKLGYKFKNIEDWVYPTIDYFVMNCE